MKYKNKKNKIHYKETKSMVKMKIRWNFNDTGENNIIVGT